VQVPEPRMKIMTVLGTRPEIIRLSRIIPALDAEAQHILVHTGQNFDAKLSDIFFDELGIRPPDHFLGIRAATPAEQIGRILAGVEALLLQHRPDRLFILGDTNSGLCAIIAKRMGIPVYHAEAGNRCFDDRVPEETNRRIIDQCSDVLMPYTQHSRRHLLAEGFDDTRIHVTGNPIYEVIQHYLPHIRASNTLAHLDLEKKKYLLVTLHRAENVDHPETLSMYLAALQKIAQSRQLPAIISTHPRLRDKLAGYAADGLHFLEPFGFFDFIHLQQHALCVLTDSGTVQEESCILGTPCVTLRRTTERPETLEAGSNILASANEDEIMQALNASCTPAGTVIIPADYLVPDVSSRITRLLLA